MRTVIGISGKQRSGKNTLADKLVKKLPDFKITPIVGLLKESYARQHGYTLEELEAAKNHDPQVRTDLIHYGKIMRDLDTNYWIKHTLQEEGNLILPDLRFKDEVNYLLEEVHNVVLVRIDVDVAIRASRGRLSNIFDPTEVDLDNLDIWDYRIENPTIHDLDYMADIIHEGTMCFSS